MFEKFPFKPTRYRITHTTKSDGYTNWQEEVRTPVAEPEKVDVHGSRLTHNVHLPVFDLDFPAELVPSSTPGHHHLYLSRPIKWRKYKKVLRAMMAAGLIEPGYYSMSRQRKEAFLYTKSYPQAGAAAQPAKNDNIHSPHVLEVDNKVAEASPQTYPTLKGHYPTKEIYPTIMSYLKANFSYRYPSKDKEIAEGHAPEADAPGPSDEWQWYA